MRPRKTSAAAEPADASRIIIRIEVTPQAKATYANLVERRGATQVATTSRLIEWLAVQRPVIQAAILGQYPAEIEADIADMLLKRLAPAPKA